MDLTEQTWALTGAAGHIGSSLREGLAGRVARLRLIDVAELAAERAGEEIASADVRDLPRLAEALVGAHGVIHLAGIPEEADFHDIADVNIAGTRNVLEAARRAGVARVVFASSNHVTGFHPPDARLDDASVPRPDTFYGVGKLAGEALGRLYADKFGLAVANIRIGSFQERPQDERQLSTWLSPADCLAAFLAAMMAPGLSYATFYGVSRNTRRWWDLAPGRALGFDPQDDAERYAAEVGTPNPPGMRQGGNYTAPSYTLDRQR